MASIDPAVERTPPSVAAMKSFKEKLLQGHKVTASQFGIELPVMEKIDIATLHTDSDPDAISEEESLFDGFVQESDPGWEMKDVDEAPRVGKRMAPKDPVQMLSEYLEETPAKEDLKIVGPFGKLGFKALNVSITDFGVAFIIKKDAIQFEPNINTELTIQYRGHDYPVIYAGGFFTFPKIPFTFVSFLRVQPE